MAPQRKAEPPKRKRSRLERGEAHRLALTRTDGEAACALAVSMFRDRLPIPRLAT